MQIHGGYIVVRAESEGTSVPPGIADKDRQKYDEASLRPRLARYVPQPFELRTAIHTIGDCTFAIIRIAPRSDGFRVFEADWIHKETARTCSCSARVTCVRRRRNWTASAPYLERGVTTSRR